MLFKEEIVLKRKGLTMPKHLEHSKTLNKAGVSSYWNQTKKTWFIIVGVKSRGDIHIPLRDTVKKSLACIETLRQFFKEY